MWHGKAAVAGPRAPGWAVAAVSRRRAAAAQLCGACMRTGEAEWVRAAPGGGGHVVLSLFYIFKIKVFK
jgi:hypothetical protein